MESCGQFERIVNDSGLIRIIRLTDEEIIGTKNSAGIIEKYFPCPRKTPPACRICLSVQGK